MHHPLRDVTPLAHRIRALVKDRDLDVAKRLLPPERPYPAEEGLLTHLGG